LEDEHEEHAVSVPTKQKEHNDKEHDEGEIYVE